MSKRWHARLGGDVGGFGAGSDFTWSAAATLAYDITLFGCPGSLFAGYRAVGRDLSESGHSDFEFDFIQHGPLLGLSLEF